MKKIKLFLIRNYQRIIRFLISFSAIGCIAFVSLPASATVVYSMPCSPIQISNNSCYLEIVRNDGFHYVIYVCAYQDTGSMAFNATYTTSENILRIIPLSNVNACFGYYIDQNGAVGNLSYNFDDDSCYIYIGSGFFISYIRGYNCKTAGLGAGSDFTFVYGNDKIIDDKLDSINQAIIDNRNSTNDKLDRIIAAIEANKSSAEKSDYSGPSSDQKQAQSDLDSAESSINADTASARSSTINILKNFAVVGDISRGLLVVTELFNYLCLQFSPSAALLNFSLAIGIVSFILGLSVFVVNRVNKRGGS